MPHFPPKLLDGVEIVNDFYDLSGRVTDVSVAGACGSSVMSLSVTPDTQSVLVSDPVIV